MPSNTHKLPLLFALIAICLSGCLGFSKDEDTESEQEQKPSSTTQNDSLKGFADTAPFLALEFYDYQTNKPISSSLTLKRHETSPNFLLSQEQKQLDSVTFKKGHVNLGLERGKGYHETGEHQIHLSLESKEYFQREFSLTVPDSGMSSYRLFLVPKDNPTEHFTTKTYENPPDSLEFNSLPSTDSSLALARILPDDQAEVPVQNFNITNFFLTPNRSSVLWLPPSIINMVNGPIYNPKITSSTWSKLPELMEPYFPWEDSDYHPDYRKSYVKLFALKDFHGNFKGIDSLVRVEGITDSNSTAYGAMPKGKVILNFDLFPGDFDNANEWFNSFLAISADGALTFQTPDFAKIWDCFFCNYPTDNNFYESVHVVKADQALDYLSTVNQDTTLAVVLINDQATDLYAKQLTISLQYNTKKNTFLPLRRFSYYTQVKTKELTYTLKNGNSYTGITIESGGAHRYYPSYSTGPNLMRVPLAPAKITVTNTIGSLSYYKDLTNFSGTLELVALSSSDSLTNINSTMNLTCADASKNFKLDQLYNTSIRYRKTGSTNDWQISSIRSLNRNEKGKITSAVLEMDAVETGTKYDIQIVGGGQVTIVPKVLQSSGTSFDFQVSDLLCN